MDSQRITAIGSVDHLGSVNTSQAASSITINETRGSILATQKTEVTVPKAYANEKLVTIRKSELDKARQLLLQAKNDSGGFPVAEVCLAIATTLIGVILSSLFADIELTSTKGIIVYCISPALSVACFAIFFWRRHESKASAHRLAERVIDYLVDPSDEE